MSENIGSEGLDVQDLADQMFGSGENRNVSDDDSPVGHPAWQEIFSKIPAEYHAQVAPVLQKWDTGVSRQFQKIHDEYAPLRQYEGLDLDQVQEALGVYESLNNDPKATWEAIGRVYGLSPQQVSQVMSQESDTEDEDVDYDDLPASIKNRLAQLDMHEQVLEKVTEELLQRQGRDKEAEEDAELENYLEWLRDEYGDYDENYVVGLIASGMDGEEAVESFFSLVSQIRGDEDEDESNKSLEYPSVLSGGGGIPSAGEVNPYQLSSQDTQALVTEILRMTNES